MKSYENYEKLRLSYKRVTKSYEKLQKVTNELSGLILRASFPKSLKNGLPITISNGMANKNKQSTRAGLGGR